jgi:hypothetical protein
MCRSALDGSRRHRCLGIPTTSAGKIFGVTTRCLRATYNDFIASLPESAPQSGGSVAVSGRGCGEEVKRAVTGWD